MKVKYETMDTKCTHHVTESELLDAMSFDVFHEIETREEFFPRIHHPESRLVLKRGRVVDCSFVIIIIVNLDSFKLVLFLFYNK